MQTPDKKNILIFPGAFQKVENYGYPGRNVWQGEDYLESPKADIFIGHSIGANLALTNFPNNPASKFILVNPLVKRRSILSLFYRWLRFYIFEGIDEKKLVSSKYWPLGFAKTLILRKINILDIIKKIPRDNIVIVRGKKDVFFCDRESAKIIKEHGIALTEVDAGHDWNKNIAVAVKKIFET